MTSNLIVDGTKEVIANGVASSMHAISKETDYTHTRIVGYAVTLEDAHLFAAAGDLREVATVGAEYLNGLAIILDEWAQQSRAGGWSTHQVEANISQAESCRRRAAQIITALVKSEVR